MCALKMTFWFKHAEFAAKFATKCYVLDKCAREPQ